MKALFRHVKLEAEVAQSLPVRDVFTIVCPDWDISKADIPIHKHPHLNGRQTCIRGCDHVVKRPLSHQRDQVTLDAKDQITPFIYGEIK